MSAPVGAGVGSAPRPAVRTPVLVTGLRAAAVGGSDGEVALPRETRGGVVEWGGVYGEGVRLTGPWTATLVWDGREFSLDSTTTTVGVERHAVVSQHRLGPFDLEQTLVAVEESPDVPAIGRRWVLRSSSPRPERIRVELAFVPFLAPVLIEGIKPYDYVVATHGRDLTVASHGFALSFHSEPLPHHLYLNRASWLGGRSLGELREVGLDYDLEIPPGGEASLAWLLAGGLSRTLGTAAATAPASLGRAPEWAAAAARKVSDWRDGTPQMDLPGRPDLVRAYDRARGALRQLYARADPELEGLVAGYPWYVSFWGRDLAWMLPAVLWLGDAAWVERSLDTMFRYQARESLPILGARAGEIPMQVSAGPIFLFGTSDTTLHYPEVVRKLVEATGRAELAERFAPGLDRVERWAREKTEPGSGLIRNGGEVAEIRSATAGVGHVHYGFDAVDTTIWDSTDRRDHAVDVQVLGRTMYDALARLAPLRKGGPPAAELHGRADALAGAIRERYAWPAERYLFDSLTRDGRPVARVRPNALRAVSAGLLDLGTARQVVARASEEDLATPWGLRTLSARDPAYSPIAYHDGQVWSIATAWAADAAFCAGDIATATGHLETLARRFEAEGGYANECYRGDRPEAFDSCFLLGFSVAPFLSVLFERLWGIEPALTEGRIRVDPRLPSLTGPARLRNLTLGPGRLDLDVDPGHVTGTWHGPGRLRLECGDGQVDLAPDRPATLERAKSS